VLVVSPNNPTGNYISQRDLDALAALCAPRDVAVIADEVFADYDLEASPALPRGCLLDRTDVLGFTLGGLSKSIGLPQAKLGWVVVSGDTTMRQDAMGRLELACDTYLSVSTPVQMAARELLDLGAPIRRQIQQRVRTNLDVCAAIVARHPSCTLLHAEGGWYGVVQVPAVVPEDELMLSLLLDHHVLVQPGYFFDFDRESFLVISLLASEIHLTDGVSRALDHIERLCL